MTGPAARHAATAPIQKPRSFGPSVKRLMHRLVSYRGFVVTGLLATVGSVILSAIAPRVLGHATDLIFTARDDFDPAVARSAELLQAELDRFESLLTDLLEISRFDAGFAALDAEHTDLVPIVASREWVEELRATLEKRLRRTFRSKG